MNAPLAIPRLERCGETAITVTWPGADDDQIPNLLAAAECSLMHSFGETIDFVRGFASLTLHYEPLEVDYDLLCQKAIVALRSKPDAVRSNVVRHEIPVEFGGVSGPDLEELVRRRNCSVSDWIRDFTAVTFRVRMIGFSPGFPYLAGLPCSLYANRRDTPREKVRAGSVAIGGSQAGVYPLDSPGGWNIVGRTRLRLFDSSKDEPCLLKPDDEVRFVVD